MKLTGNLAHPRFLHLYVKEIQSGKRPISEWMDNENVITAEFHSAGMKEDIMTSAGKWLDLGSIVVSKVTPKLRKTNATFSPSYVDPGL